MKKLEWIYGLKFYLAIMVCMRHFVNAFIPAVHIDGASAQVLLGKTSLENLINSTPLYLFINGGYAVYVFWTITGFLIAYQFYISNIQMRKRLLKVRIVKKYLITICPILITYCIAFCGMKVGFFYNQEASVYTKSDWLYNFYGWNPTLKEMLHSAFVDTFFYGNVPYNPVLWTMKIDFYGSIICILLLNLFGDSKLRYMLYFLIGALCIHIFPMEYLCFLFGTIWGDIFVNTPNKRREHAFGGWHSHLPYCWDHTLAI